MQSQVFTLILSLVFLNLASAHPAPVEFQFTQSLESRDASTAQDFDASITWYDPSVGDNSCGWVNQNWQLVTAISEGMMGEQSNGNPNCARQLVVNANGRSIVVYAVDKCSACGYYDLDLSGGAFKALGLDLGVGRVAGSWHWL